jgi:hypothetical protein
MGEEQPAGKQVKKISISLSDDVLEWVCNNPERLKVSTFINKVLRERMHSGGVCNVCDGLERLEQRIDMLEKALIEYQGLRAARVGQLGPVAPATTRPAEVFGARTQIKNVSAANARAVAEELIPFLQQKKIIYRDLVLRELFPRTRSSITNDINYWYNACKGVLDRLIERGYVVRAEKGKYRWVGTEGAVVE